MDSATIVSAISVEERVRFEFALNSKVMGDSPQTFSSVHNEQYCAAHHKLLHGCGDWEASRMRANVFLLGVALLAFGTIPALAATTYQYDTLGRLWKVCYANGLTITYTYDPMGNRTSVATQSGVTCS